MRGLFQLMAAVVTGALLMSTGCDPTVDVFRPSGSPVNYSLHGWLDVAADTQSIRVEPVGDGLRLGSPQALDVSVVVEDFNADTTVRLQDSLATVNPSSHRDPAQVHNFWTTYPLHMATTYQVRLRRDDQTIASATMTSPSHEPELLHNYGFIHGCYNKPFLVFVRDARRIAAAHVTYPADEGPEGNPLDVPPFPTFDLHDKVEKIGNRFVIAVNYGSHEVCWWRQFIDADHEYAIVKVAVGGSDWPAWRESELNTIGRTDTFSNVKGGLGFVGTAYTDTIKVPFNPGTVGGR